MSLTNLSQAGNGKGGSTKLLLVESTIPRPTPCNPTDANIRKVPVHTCHPNESAWSGVGPSTPSNASEEDVKEVERATTRKQAASVSTVSSKQGKMTVASPGGSQERADTNKSTKVTACETAKTVGLNHHNHLETSRPFQFVAFQLFVATSLNEPTSVNSSSVGGRFPTSFESISKGLIDGQLGSVVQTRCQDPMFFQQVKKKEKKPDARISAFRSS